MDKYAQGSEVAIHFEGSFVEGEVFESTLETEPMCFVLGSGDVLEEIEKAIQSMDIGQTKKIRITCEQGYGPYQEEKILKIPKESMPPMGNINAGEQIIVRNPEGEEMPAIILSVDDDQVTIDANHPLAGEDMDFTVTLIEVAPPEE